MEEDINKISLGDLNMRGKMPIKLDIKELNTKRGSVAGLCEHRTEPSGFKYGIIIMFSRRNLLYENS
jgi:hypothetical protein